MAGTDESRCRLASTFVRSILLARASRPVRAARFVSKSARSRQSIPLSMIPRGLTARPAAALSSDQPAPADHTEAIGWGSTHASTRVSERHGVPVNAQQPEFLANHLLAKKSTSKPNICSQRHWQADRGAPDTLAARMNYDAICVGSLSHWPRSGPRHPPGKTNSCYLRHVRAPHVHQPSALRPAIRKSIGSAGRVPKARANTSLASRRPTD